MQESHLVSGCLHSRQLPSTWLKSAVVSGFSSGPVFSTLVYNMERVVSSLLGGHRTRGCAGALRWHDGESFVACCTAPQRYFWGCLWNISESQFASVSLLWGIKSWTGSRHYCIYYLHIHRCPQSWYKIGLISKCDKKWVQLCGVCETGRLNINMNYICHLHVNNPLHKWIYHVNPHSSPSTLISLPFTFSFPPFVHLSVCWKFNVGWWEHVFQWRSVWCVCFTTNLWISDWSGNWSDPARSHYRSLSSERNLVHSGETFRSTSSTDTTEHRERERMNLFIHTFKTWEDLCALFLPGSSF